jgi:uncharacterized protein
MASGNTVNRNQHPEKGKPWWKYPIVWLVVGGPLVVVIASIVTAGLAIKHVDPVLDTSDKKIQNPSELPAIKARNHAAEGSKQPAEQ